MICLRQLLKLFHIKSLAQKTYRSCKQNLKSIAVSNLEVDEGGISDHLERSAKYKRNIFLK